MTAGRGQASEFIRGSGFKGAVSAGETLGALEEGRSRVPLVARLYGLHMAGPHDISIDMAAETCLLPGPPCAFLLRNSSGF